MPYSICFATKTGARAHTTRGGGGRGAGGNAPPRDGPPKTQPPDATRHRPRTQPQGGGKRHRGSRSRTPHRRRREGGARGGRGGAGRGGGGTEAATGPKAGSAPEDRRNRKQTGKPHQPSNIHDACSCRRLNNIVTNASKSSATPRRKPIISAIIGPRGSNTDLHRPRPLSSI